MQLLLLCGIGLACYAGFTWDEVGFETSRLDGFLQVITAAEFSY